MSSNTLRSSYAAAAARRGASTSPASGLVSANSSFNSARSTSTISAIPDPVGNAFRNWREAGQFFDVTLWCDNQESIPCHRLRLAAYSKYFENKFKDHHGVGSADLVIVIKNAKFGELSAVVDFIYNGKVDDRAQNYGVLMLMRDLEIEGLGLGVAADGNGAKTAPVAVPKTVTSNMQMQHAPAPTITGTPDRNESQPIPSPSTVASPMETNAHTPVSAATVSLVPGHPESPMPRQVQFEHGLVPQNQQSTSKAQHHNNTPNGTHGTPAAAATVARVQQGSASHGNQQQTPQRSQPLRLNFGIATGGARGAEVKGEGDDDDEITILEPEIDVEELARAPSAPPQSPHFQNRRIYSPATRDDALAKIRAGMSTREISEITGVPQGTIQKWNRQMGPKPQPMWRGSGTGVGNGTSGQAQTRAKMPKRKSKPPSHLQGFETELPNGNYFNLANSTAVQNGNSNSNQLPTLLRGGGGGGTTTTAFSGNNDAAGGRRGQQLSSASPAAQPLQFRDQNGQVFVVQNGQNEQGPSSGPPILYFMNGNNA